MNKKLRSFIFNFLIKSIISAPFLTLWTVITILLGTELFTQVSKTYALKMMSSLKIIKNSFYRKQEKIRQKEVKNSSKKQNKTENYAASYFNFLIKRILSKPHSWLLWIVIFYSTWDKTVYRGYQKIVLWQWLKHSFLSHFFWSRLPINPPPKKNILILPAQTQLPRWQQSRSNSIGNPDEPSSTSSSEKQHCL